MECTKRKAKPIVNHGSHFMCERGLVIFGRTDSCRSAAAAAALGPRRVHTHTAMLASHNEIGGPSVSRR